MKYEPGKSLVYYGVNDIRVEAPERKYAIGQGDVLVKVEACAICGSDIKTLRNGNPRISPATIIGHEFCGTVVEAGEGAKEYLGKRVSMATSIGCGKCFYCRGGKTNLCEDIHCIGFRYDGAMSGYVRIPADAVSGGYLVDVGTLEAPLAALCEPVSCVVNGLGRLDFSQIKNALVIGLGPLGFFHALALRLYGVKNVVASDLPGQRFDMAKSMGFRVLLPDDLPKAYRDASDGIGFDLVVTAAPVAKVQEDAPGYARKGGYVSFFASLPKGKEMLTINSRTVHYGELIVYGTSDSTPAHARKALEIIGGNRDDFKRVVTHVLPIPSFYDAISLIDSQRAVKVVLTPE